MRKPRSKYRYVPAFLRREAERQSPAFKPHEPPRRSGSDRSSLSSCGDFVSGVSPSGRLAVWRTTPDVAMHVEQTPAIWLLAADRMRLVAAVSQIPASRG